MSSLTTTVEQYKSILPVDLYDKLYQAAAEVSEELVPIMEPAFRIELHKACETYFVALKQIGKEMHREKAVFLKETEDRDKQSEIAQIHNLYL